MSSAFVRLSIDCSMNVAGRKIVVSTSMLGKTGLHLVHRVLDALRDLHRVGAAELLDDQHQAGAVVDDALAPDRLVVLLHPPEVGEAQRRGCRPAHDRHLAEVLRALDRLHVADVQPLAVLLDEPAGADHEAVRVLEHAGVDRLGGGLHHLVERDAVLGQLRRIDLHVALLEPLAEDVDLRHARHAQQALPDLPVGDRGHLDQVQLVRGEPDLHDPAGRRQRRHDPRRARPGRQRRRRPARRAPVTSWRALSSSVPLLEDEPDRRELRDGLRAQLVDARRCPGSCSSIGTVISSSTSVEELPSAIVWISTCGGANSGNTSTFAFGIWATPEHHHRRGGEQHQPPEPEASGNDPTHYSIPPCSISGFRRSRARCRTPRSLRLSRPWCRRAGPLTGTPARPSMRSTVTGARRYVSGFGLV